MQKFNNDDEDGAGKRSPASGGSSGTQLVVGIVAMLLGSVFLLGGLVLWVGGLLTALVGLFVLYSSYGMDRASQPTGPSPAESGERE